MLRAVFLIVALLFASSTLAAQTSPPAPPPTDREVTAVFTDEPPRVDGHIDELMWTRIDPVQTFIQVWPETGSDATERTEVRIAYDRDYLYFAFQNFDNNPELIRAKNLERGGRNDRDDHVYIGLDTYQDGRNAYLFEMNALGTQDDATITDEGLTIDSFSWDAVFRSETVIDESGWSMEVAIPFRQLRFPEGDDLSFGLMLSRMINRKNERVMWPEIGLERGSSFAALATVSQYGVLKGLKNVRRGRNLEIKPYMITDLQREGGGNAAAPALLTEFIPGVGYAALDAGLDIKYGLTSNLTLDASINTDFAQVEADNVQLNLSRFSLFFPEKREFFLERSGLFEHGNPRSTQTFFSRRIGLADQILAGARLTGQAGPISVGALNIATGPELSDFLGSQMANNTVVRARADVLPRTTVGAIGTSLLTDSTSNRALGLDGQIRFGGNSLAEVWGTQVWDSDESQNSAAGHALVQLQTDTYGAQASVTSVGSTYAPALGFVRRRDMRRATGRLLYRPLVSIASLPFIRRVQVQTDGAYIEGQDGELQSTSLEAFARLDFNRRDNLGVTVERQFERLDQAFEIREDVEIPADDYTFTQFGIGGETDSSRPVFAQAQARAGGFFSGNRIDLGGNVGWRQSQHLVLEGGIDHSIIDLPTTGGEFSATSLSLSILSAINRDLFARSLIQYDNFSRDIQANIRVNWIHTPGSDLFFVFNTSYNLPGEDDDMFDPRRDLVLNDRVAVLKLTYLVLL
ncbi:MAG: hypothetical protein Rubg2KO_16520 [Rubricoccaceae bacterium]